MYIGSVKPNEQKIIVHVTCNSVHPKQPLYVNNFKPIFSLYWLYGVNDLPLYSY